MKLIPVDYYGFTAMDKRFSSPMLPWIVSEIRKRTYVEKEIILSTLNSYTAGNIFVGFDSCSVFNAIDISRCFTCNEFHHSAKRCNKLFSYRLCGDNHEVKACKSLVCQCSNCVKLARKDIATTYKNKLRSYTSYLSVVKPVYHRKHRNILSLWTRGVNTDRFHNEVLHRFEHNGNRAQPPHLKKLRAR